MTVATARAYPNIALVKYWGKADARLKLPATGSLSLTLDAFPTTTTVTTDAAAEADRLFLGGAEVDGEPLVRVRRFLDLVRELAGSGEHAVVRSRNTVPTGAGLASSAAGFAALAVAAAAAYGLRLDRTQLSRLARRGSGSASRSIIGGVAVWHAGDDESSFAEPVAAPPMAMVIATVDAGPKSISSSAAMERTVSSSPFYPAWVDSTAQSLSDMLAACRDGDMTRIGRIAETNALRMHAVIQSCDPPVRYLTARSVEVLDRVVALRGDGVGAWSTIDAGPNIAVVCRPEDAQTVCEAVGAIVPAQIAGPGPGAHLLDAHEAVAE